MTLGAVASALMMGTVCFSERFVSTYKSKTQKTNIDIFAVVRTSYIISANVQGSIRFGNLAEYSKNCCSLFIQQARLSLLVVFLILDTTV
jgi:hypothetical protein